MVIDFSPYGLTAKADASGVDLKVRGLFTIIHVYFFDTNCHKLPINFHKLLLFICVSSAN